MSEKHVLVFNTPMTHDFNTGESSYHADACHCTFCHTQVEEDDPTENEADDMSFDEELAEAIENRDVERITELVAELDDDERDELLENLSDDEDEEHMEHTYDPNAGLSDPRVLMNYGDEQNGEAKVSKSVPFDCPHSELFGPGVDHGVPLTPLSPWSERTGHQMDYGTPLPAPAMNFDDSPVAQYYRNRR